MSYLGEWFVKHQLEWVENHKQISLCYYMLQSSVYEFIAVVELYSFQLYLHKHLVSNEKCKNVLFLAVVKNIF